MIISVVPFRFAFPADDLSVFGIDLKLIFHAVITDVSFVDQASVITLQFHMEIFRGSSRHHLQRDFFCLRFGDLHALCILAEEVILDLIIHVHDPSGIRVDLVIVLFISHIELYIIDQESVVALQFHS